MPLQLRHVIYLLPLNLRQRKLIKNYIIIQITVANARSEIHGCNFSGMPTMLDVITVKLWTFWSLHSIIVTVQVHSQTYYCQKCHVHIENREHIQFTVTYTSYTCSLAMESSSSPVIKTSSSPMTCHLPLAESVDKNISMTLSLSRLPVMSVTHYYNKR